MFWAKGDVVPRQTSTMQQTVAAQRNGPRPYHRHRRLNATSGGASERLSHGRRRVALSCCSILRPVVLAGPVCGNDIRVSPTHFPSLSACYQMSLRFDLTLYLLTDFFQLFHVAPPPPSPPPWVLARLHVEKGLKVIYGCVVLIRGPRKTAAAVIKPGKNLKLDSTFLPHSLFWACVSVGLRREEEK